MKINLLIGILAATIFYSLINLPVYSFDLQSGAFSVNAETKDIDTIGEVQKVNELLDDLENNWNLHNADKVLKNYSYDSYIYLKSSIWHLPFEILFRTSFRCLEQSSFTL